MGDAIKSRAATSKPKTAPKATAQAQKLSKPKRSNKHIPAEVKNKAPVPEVEEEDDEALVLRKLNTRFQTTMTLIQWQTTCTSGKMQD